jgi:hypothetical protein
MASEYLHQTAALLTGSATAVLSADRAYRYRLERRWGESPLVTWIMLNPSTADAFTDDSTIRRCTAFANAWGFGGLIVVNLFALRATDPRELRAHGIDAIGPGNDEFIRKAISPWPVVVAAWGAGGTLHGRGAQVTRNLAADGIDMNCLGVTKDGQPKHPLYLRADTELMPFPTCAPPGCTIAMQGGRARGWPRTG